MFDDPKKQQEQENQNDQGSAGGQSYQDAGNTGVTQNDLNQDSDTEDLNEE